MTTDKERLLKLVRIQTQLQKDRLKHLEGLSRLNALKREQAKTQTTQKA